MGYEGLSAETDKELRVLRGHLSGKPDFTLATVSINKLNTHIQHADTSVKQHTQLTVKELEKAIKQFQSTFQQNKKLSQLIDSYAKKQPDEPKVVDLRTKLESQLSEEE